MLCEFSLPSNPKVKVRLREATVAEAIDFSSIDPDCEEEASSLFLETVQEKETYTDPRQWTGEDRRYALFQYFVSTSTYRSIPLSYTCSICGQPHTQDIELKRILEDYTPIKGEAARDFPHEGHNVIVRPLNGADLEDIEKYRYDMLIAQQKLEEFRAQLSATEIRRVEAEIRAKKIRMAMLRIICSIDMPHLDQSSTPRERRELVEKKLKEMPAAQFKEFMKKVDKAIFEMRHGLRTTYIDGRIMLEIPDVKCDLNPDAPGVILRYPFRFSDVIPTL